MKRNYGYWLLTCALVAVSCFGGYEFYRARRYEAAVLLLCRSAGSGFEHCFDEIVQSKIRESAAFFRASGFAGVDDRLLALLISAQFDSYRRIVAECPDREAAEKYMNALMVYHFGGWAAFFESIRSSTEGDKI